MSPLKDKKILLAVCGSIAAYKAAMLVRLMVKVGAQVKVIMTSGAKDFVTPLTFATLSKNEVYHHFYDADTGLWNSHIEVALWADVILVAPASANEIAKMANGICDNFFTAVYLSARCQVIVAPAMDMDMYAHPTTARNLDKLKNDGVRIIEVGVGELASGLSGKGRMQEPENILLEIEHYFANSQKLKGKKILITSGPTQEAIDPVRYISNHSTGKMGYALAQKCVEYGAEVTLISGPVNMKPPQVHKLLKITTAMQMFTACKPYFETTDVAIFTAAVADYRAKEVQPGKIKKNDETFEITLTKNPDIAFEFGKVKSKTQLSIGFALETHDLVQNARKKLEEKNFDMIALNSPNDDGAAFGSDTNKITIFFKNTPPEELPFKPKIELAGYIVDRICNMMPH